MKRVLVPVLCAIAALALIGLLAFGLVSRAEDTTLEQAMASGERPVAASRELPRVGAAGTQSLADLRRTFVIDAQGRVVDLYRGQISQERLDRALDRAMR